MARAAGNPSAKPNPKPNPKPKPKPKPKPRPKPNPKPEPKPKPSPNPNQAHGIGGSESAVISISAQLAALGWGVEVYANPSLADTGRDASGVLWLPH